MDKILQAQADKCRAYHGLAKQAGNTVVAARWELAAQQIENAIRSARIARGVVPTGC